MFALVRERGSITVEDYMGRCNAHYYATRDPIGAEGDFTTAPEISQMFGEMVGAALADCWLRAGAPADAVYAELGPGRGTLAADALRVLRRSGFAGEVHFIETSPVLREIQGHVDGYAQWHESLLTLPKDASLLLVANEFFDALPIRQWIDGEERGVELVDGRPRFDRDGEIVEDSPARLAVATQIAAHVGRSGGAALIIDYGHSQSAPGDTFQAVRGHCFADPLESSGEQDLTAHVDFAALAAAASEAGAAVTPVVEQGRWLEQLGIGARAEALATANPPEAEAIAAARRRLCDPAGMGRLFKVLAIHSAGWPRPLGFGA